MSVLDLFRLDGKVAIVTGASSGLGVSFAQALAEARTGGGPNLALAGEERTVPTEPSVPPPPDPAPPLDLDELSEEVYILLRRRLAVERERYWT